MDPINLNISNVLELWQILMNSEETQVKLKMMPTIADGKVCNAATETLFTMKCYMKTMILERFKKRSGLIVDIPKPGYGNTNEGNTSRWFFTDPKIASEITGVDIIFFFIKKIFSRRLVHLTRDMNINNQFKDNEKFDEFCKETASLYVKFMVPDDSNCAQNINTCL